MCVTSQPSEALIGCATENICVAWQPTLTHARVLEKRKLSTQECIETKDGFPVFIKKWPADKTKLCARRLGFPSFSFEMGETNMPNCSYSDHDLQRILFDFLNLFKKNE